MINDATPIFLNMEGAAVFMGEDVPHPKGKEKGRLLSQIHHQKKRKTSLRLTGQADRMFLRKKTIINEVHPI
ncbi:MAG: hypothetical protein K9L23_07930 [Desulfotignum sp.]|nr:hypothetical protein [Desulfotignum sp.]